MVSTPPVRIDRFREYMREAGVEEIVEETLRVYLDEAPDRLRRLERALEHQNAREVEMEAHALRSASLNIRADGLAGLLEQAEHAGVDGDLEAARRLTTLIGEELARVAKYLQEALGEHR